jgi:hypothetical protein
MMKRVIVYAVFCAIGFTAPAWGRDFETEQVSITRSEPTDVKILTREIQQKVPHCVGLSRSGNQIIVHLDQKADPALARQIQGIIAGHQPPLPKNEKKDFTLYRARYQAAQSPQEKVRILAQWFDFEDGP